MVMEHSREKSTPADSLTLSPVEVSFIAPMSTVCEC